MARYSVFTYKRKSMHYHSEKNSLNKFVLLAFLSIILTTSGCHRVVTKHNPNHTATKFSKIYLQRSEANKQFQMYSAMKDELELLGFTVSMGPEETPTDNADAMKKELELLGFTVSMGPEKTPTDKADVIMTYQDKWMWDMTMYLLKLDVSLVDADNMVPISETSILRTTSIRRSKKYMVREALSELFFSPEVRDKYINSDIHFNGYSEISDIYLYLDLDAKEYEKVISFFFTKKNLNFSTSDLKVPSKEFTTICNIFTLRGRKFLQFRDREKNKLIAEVFLERKNDEDENENEVIMSKATREEVRDKKILARLETLFSLHKAPNSDPPYFYLNP